LLYVSGVGLASMLSSLKSQKIKGLENENSLKSQKIEGLENENKKIQF